jgi:hypothetical protein
MNRLSIPLQHQRLLPERRLRGSLTTSTAITGHQFGTKLLDGHRVPRPGKNDGSWELQVTHNDPSVNRAEGDSVRRLAAQPSGTTGTLRLGNRKA